MMHSGRQLGGTPNMPAIQEHIGCDPESLHSEFGPHGLGTHGFEFSTGIPLKLKNNLINKFWESSGREESR